MKLTIKCRLASASNASQPLATAPPPATALSLRQAWRSSGSAASTTTAASPSRWSRASRARYGRLTESACKGLSPSGAPPSRLLSRRPVTPTPAERSAPARCDNHACCRKPGVPAYLESLHGAWHSLCTPRYASRQAACMTPPALRRSLARPRSSAIATRQLTALEDGMASMRALLPLVAELAAVSGAKPCARCCPSPASTQGLCPRAGMAKASL